MITVNFSSKTDSCAVSSVVVPLSNESNLTEEVTNTSNTQIAIYTTPTPISKARLPETAVELLIIAQREEGILYSWTNIEWVKIIKNITDVEVTVSKVVEIGSLAAMVSGFLVSYEKVSSLLYKKS